MIIQQSKSFQQMDTNNYPLLNKLVNVYRQYEQRQRFLSGVFQGKELVDDEVSFKVLY